MTKLFRNSSIRVRLSLLVVLNGGFALALVGLSLLGYQKFELHQAATRNLSIEAGIIADSSTAALTFMDERAAMETLTALRRDPDLVEAAIYDRNNHLFAWHERPNPNGVEAQPPEKPPSLGAHIVKGELVVAQRILLENNPLGTVFLKASLSEVDARLRQYVETISLVLLVSLGLALLLSGKMRQGITGPLAHLASVARFVSTEKDYSVRAVRKGGGEIAFLIDSFNGMLAQIELRERAQKSAEESLRESEERFALSARGANDGLWDWKRSTGEMYLSPRGNQMLGYLETERYWSTGDWMSQVHHSDRPRVADEWNEGIREAREEYVSEFRMRHQNNTSIWVLSRGRSVKDAEGAIVRVAGSLTDITEGKVADALTGLRSRFYFLDRLESAIDATDQRGLPFAVLFLDLDRFKLVNDSLGHAAGDELLTEIARRLRTSVQGAASFAGPSVIARLGGDEFAVLLHGAGQAEAEEVARWVLQHLSAPFRLGSQQMYPGVSIGIAMSSSGEDPEDLLRNADTAMYQAKKLGRGRIEVFDERMRKLARARLEIEAELRDAIKRQELVVHYQAQVSIESQDITGFEALVRWQHPTRGLIPPDEFIPIAEETDLIVPLGAWVLREACRQMVEWHKGYAHSPLPTISVNVSYKQLKREGFVEEVQRILAETGLPPEMLRLEMTESTVMANAEEAGVTLQRLKDMKIGLEIDDFGTGYSSLSCLSRLPFDTVKIDRSFIRDLGSSEERSEIVRAILELSRSMNLTVVAEGVETGNQLRELDALGCSHAQGYYISRPLCAAATVGFFESQSLRRLSERVGETVCVEQYAAS
jgi:diguanylate cyclase (GGDEF)-like protein/PAS domain S-box-containing protein